jgi:hypothetical protein
MLIEDREIEATTIIEILHSFDRVYIEDGELQIIFKDSTDTYSIREFDPSSFTRKILELIEDSLLETVEESDEIS